MVLAFLREELDAVLDPEEVVAPYEKGEASTLLAYLSKRSLRLFSRTSQGFARKTPLEGPRIRRIKCDEGRPACSKCVSTGRVCDGYGVWGGGGKMSTRSTSYLESCVVSKPLARPSLAGGASQEEHNHFEWFTRRTAPKLPGIFGSRFWDTLVLQASYSEPAVMHAVLALSSVHKRASLEATRNRRPEGIPDDKEQFSLRQYSKAINILGKLVFRDKGSVRVTLVTCMVFICLEYLRGHYTASKTHLQYGMRLLTYVAASSGRAIDILNSLDPVDNWLMESFTSLNLQAMLFGNETMFPGSIPQTIHSQQIPVLFNSLHEARACFDRLLNEVVHLEQSCKRERVPGMNYADFPTPLIHWQQRLQGELESWLATYTVSRVKMQAHMGRLGKIAYHILRPYHTMANIATDTCLRPEGETCFDAYTHQFISIITQSSGTSNMIKSTDLSDTPFAYDSALCHFVADIGWIPPLYYTALKCRVHRVRLQAIKLLMSVLSKEGIWNSRIAAHVAQGVMEVEERDFYKDTRLVDDFPLDSQPSISDLALPSLPEAYRVHDVEVLLPSSPLEEATYICRRKTYDGSWEDLIDRYK
ncbi:hypothetical protein G7046_g6272 [Stylonectria norvegica]|nr:hypothetical protein G7046_g6272 [Stylonectria norvegica]